MVRVELSYGAKYIYSHSILSFTFSRLGSYSLFPCFAAFILFRQVVGANMWVLRPEPGNSARVSSAPPHSITSVATMSVVLSQLPCGPVLWKELESYDYIYMQVIELQSQSPFILDH